MSVTATTLILPSAVVQAIAALSHNNTECCGLLLGRGDGTRLLVDEALPSDNLAVNPATEFEIDVALRLRVQRQIRGQGRRVLGLYHTHPSGSTAASTSDHARAKDEPGLIWLIAAQGALQAYIAGTDGLSSIQWVEQ